MDAQAEREALYVGADPEQEMAEQERSGWHEEAP
jgi:hypothetical protein